MKVDKDEGYEVLYFIEILMDKHNMKNISDVHKIENAIHLKELSSVVLRKELVSRIEILLNLN